MMRLGACCSGRPRRQPVSTGRSAPNGAETSNRLWVGLVEYVERAMPGLDPDPIAWVQLLGDPLPWGSDAVARYSDGTNFFIAGNNLFKHCASAR